MNKNILFLLLLIFFAGCDSEQKFISLFEPSGSFNTGDVIEINFTVNTTNVSTYDGYGAFGVEIPELWEVINVSQSGYINDTFNESTKMLNILIDDYGVREGYKWVSFIGNTKSNPAIGSIHYGKTFINITTNGTFNLRYAVGNDKNDIYNFITDNYTGSSFSVLGSNLSSYSYNVDSCRVLTRSGNYVLTNDISNDITNCIYILKENTNFDCQSNTITYGSSKIIGGSAFYLAGNDTNLSNCNLVGTDLGSSVDGIYVRSSQNIIKNFNISYFYEGIKSEGSYNYFNNIMSYNNTYGVRLYGKNDTINNSVISNNSAGIELKTSDNNVLNSNIFENKIYGLVNEQWGGDFLNLNIYDNGRFDYYLGSLNSFYDYKKPTSFVNVSDLSGNEIKYFYLTGASDFVLENKKYSLLIFGEDFPFNGALNLKNITIVGSGKYQNNGLLFYDFSSSTKTHTFEDINSSNNYLGFYNVDGLFCNYVLKDSILTNNLKSSFEEKSMTECLPGFIEYPILYNNSFDSDKFVTSRNLTLDYLSVGNFWLNSTNGGFSQICDDLDNNSFCDGNLTIVNSSGNLAVDYFPQTTSYLYDLPVSIPVVNSSSSVSITSLPSFGTWSSFVAIMLVFVSLLL